MEKEKDRYVIPIIFNEKNQLLLAKVKDEHLEFYHPLTYLFPGSAIREGETNEQALVRGTKDELGIDIRVIAQLNFVIHPLYIEEIYYYHCEMIDPNQPFKESGVMLEKPFWVDFDKITDFMSTESSNPDVLKYIRMKINGQLED